jgi:hypothetical protein
LHLIAEQNLRRSLLYLAIVTLASCALIRLTIGFYTLVWEQGLMGAIDLKLRHRDVHAWFAGIPVYRTFTHAAYPPASQALLWVFIGWLPFEAVRWLWAATLVPILGGLAYFFAYESHARTRAQRLLIVLVPLSITATRNTIGNGQLVLHLMLPLLAGVLILARRPVDWRTDLLAALLILFTLIKPTLSAPFLWLVLLLPGRLRPTLLVATGYVALTCFAVLFQPDGWDVLLRYWRNLVDLTFQFAGHTTVVGLLDAFDLRAFATPVSAALFIAFGAWVYRYRRIDPWLLLGVAAFVARTWSYARPYDDLLMIVPIVSLFRIAQREPIDRNTRLVAELLVVAMVICNLIPGNIVGWPPPGRYLIEAIFVSVWGAALFFLMRETHRDAEARVRD